MNKVSVVLVAIMMLCCMLLPGNAQSCTVLHETDGPAKNIVVIGSSVAAGWVSSYQQKHDFKNGWAFRLERMLKPRNIFVVNASVPGETTSGVLERFEKDVLSKNPDYAVIALSLSNEGIEGENPEEIYKQYLANMHTLVQLCKTNGVVPVIGSCYACDDYNQDQYAYTKKMNLELNAFEVPMINFLGALEDGHGHFPKGCTYDESHPDNAGHEELFHAIVPGLFNCDADRMKGAALNDDPGQYISISNAGGENALSFVPEAPMHSFAVRFAVKTRSQGELMNIQCVSGNSSFFVKEGAFQYRDINGHCHTIDHKMNAAGWNVITVSHRYFQHETSIFAGNEMVLRVTEDLLPLHFNIGAKIDEAYFKNLLIYRAALNTDEVKYINSGSLYTASLEAYAPLINNPEKNNSIGNFAVSSACVKYFPDDVSESIFSLKRSIEKAVKKAENGPSFPPRKPVRVEPSILQQYAGKYKIGENDFVEVSCEEGQLYFTDRGRKAKIFAESDSCFFVKYPAADIKIVFTRIDNSSSLLVQMMVNGNAVMKGEKED